MSEARKIIERLVAWDDGPDSAQLWPLDPIIQDARAYLERTKEEGWCGACDAGATEPLCDCHPDKRAEEPR